MFHDEIASGALSNEKVRQLAKLCHLVRSRDLNHPWSQWRQAVRQTEQISMRQMNGRRKHRSEFRRAPCSRFLGAFWYLDCRVGHFLWSFEEIDPHIHGYDRGIVASSKQQFDNFARVEGFLLTIYDGIGEKRDGERSVGHSCVDIVL
jgi:hypothetical protein